MPKTRKENQNSISKRIQICIIESNKCLIFRFIIMNVKVLAKLYPIWSAENDAEQCSAA